MKLLQKYPVSRMHEWLFYAFVFLIPIQLRILYKPDVSYINWYFDYHLAFFFYFTDILLIACLASWFIFDRPRNVLQSRLFGLFLLFFGLILVTLLHVKHLDLGLYGTLKWLEILLLIIYIYVVFREKWQFRLTAWVLLISGVFQALFGLMQFHVQHMLGLTLLGEYIPPLGSAGLATIETSVGKVIRAYGTMPHPNILGAFLILSLISGLYLIASVFAKASPDKRETSRAKQTFLGIALILINLGIFVTFSRLAWLAATIATGIYLVYFFKRPDRRSYIILILVVIVSCATIFGFYHQDLKARVTDSNQTSITDRYFFDHVGLNLIARYPVLGVGVGNYVPAMEDFYHLQPWQYQPAHNIFIFTAAELGLLGAALFAIVLFEIFSQLKNGERGELTLALALLGILFLALSQFDHYFATIQQGRLMFAVALGLIAAVPNLKKIPDDN
jgi:hypothetical protein